MFIGNQRGQLQKEPAQAHTAHSAGATADVPGAGFVGAKLADAGASTSAPNRLGCTGGDSSSSAKHAGEIEGAAAAILMGASVGSSGTGNQAATSPETRLQGEQGLRGAQVRTADVKYTHNGVAMRRVTARGRLVPVAGAGASGEELEGQEIDEEGVNREGGVAEPPRPATARPAGVPSLPLQRVLGTRTHMRQPAASAGKQTAGAGT